MNVLTLKKNKETEKNISGFSYKKITNSYVSLPKLMFLSFGSP